MSDINEKEEIKTIEEDENNKRSYKFIEDENVVGIVHYKMDHVFHEMHECLKSEKVDITFSDMMKAYDIYLRIVGLGVGNIGNPISSLIGHINCKDISNDINSDKIPSTTYEVLFKSVNQVVDDNRKFDNIDNVINNLSIIFKEFTIFTNDTIDYIFEFANRSSSPNVVSMMFECKIEYKESVSYIIFSLMRDTFGFAIRLSSNIISESNGETSINILVDTFPEEVQQIITKIAEKDGVTITKKQSEEDK